MDGDCWSSQWKMKIIFILLNMYIYFVIWNFYFSYIETMYTAIFGLVFLLNIHISMCADKSGGTEERKVVKLSHGLARKGGAFLRRSE